MRNVFGSIVLFLALAVIAACSDSSSGSPTGSTGSSTTTGSGAGGSTSSTAGPTTSSTASTTSSTATTTGGGGNGGAAGGGSGGSAVNDASAPDGSPIGDATFGDASRPVIPSAGCGKMNPATGMRSIMTGGQTGTFIVKLPMSGYNANVPQRLGLGFHGFGNPACDPTAGGECQGFPQLPAVTVYMKSLPASPGWEQANVLEANITFFTDVVNLMKNEYCIDTNHIFVAGVSSGGQFVEYLACRFGDWLWQVTPVSASVVQAANMNCKGTPPILVIHGVTDNAGNYGQDVAAMFARRNGCSNMPPAMLMQTYTDLRADFNAMPRVETYKCLDWDNCTIAPVRICLHSQYTYTSNGVMLTHGWPRVGGQLISAFQATIP
jgi:hypothetical protein